MKRYWSKIMLVEDCWIYTGPLNSGGYGPHRSAYEELIGSIPDGMDLDHLCRVRSCINPEHLEPVSRSENVLRGTGPAVSRERNAARDRCKYGHPFDEANTRVYRGKRFCRTCHREYYREYMRNRRAA